MNIVPVADHMRHALVLKPEEKILREEFGSWLPDTIIDCHAHCNLETHVNFVSDHAYGHMLSTFTYFGLEDSIKLRDLFFPERTVHSLRFPKTFRGIDHRAANDDLTPKFQTTLSTGLLVRIRTYEAAPYLARSEGAN
jgi:hypothetical protein